MSEILHKDLTERIIGALIEVHRYWGPGLYEEIYERSLCRELDLQGIEHVNQLQLPLQYKGESVGDSLRVDVLVEAKVVIELKTVKHLLPVHEAQILTYMKLTECRVGLLVNFYEARLKDGLKRFVL